MPSIGLRLDTLKARRLLGGFSVSELAKKANVGDWTILTLEDGGSVLEADALRILDALAPAVAITSNSQANPSVCTTATHLFQTGDTAVIAGVVGSNADINGTRVVTRVNATSFSVPVNASTAGGTGGTATASLASIGVARL